VLPACRTLRRPLPRRLLLLGVLGALVLLRYFDVHPWVLRPGDPTVPGQALGRSTAGDLLLLVDPVQVRRSSTAGVPAAQDWSYGWVNLLAQEFGPAAVLAPAELTPERLAGRRAVVVTRSVAAAGGPGPLLGPFVAAGGLLFVEQPGPGWSLAAGVQPAGDLRPLTSLTLAGAPGRLPELARLPGTWSAQPLQCTPPATPLVLAAGEPRICAAPQGRGLVVVSGLDAGALLPGLQQGLPPGPGDGLATRHPAPLSPHLQTADLVADVRLLDNAVPYADLLERLLAGLLDLAGPLPRWWGYPEGRPGAYLVTHDEEGMGDRATWMVDLERTLPGGRSTWFLLPGSGLTTHGVGLLRAGGALGLHWDLTADPQNGNLLLTGIGPVRPLATRLTLGEQGDWYLRRVGVSPTLNRNHYLLWEESWAAPFARLAAAGVLLDSSYGPDVQCRGYLFGTGRPFTALSEQGLPLPIQELPFQVAEELGGADAAFLEELLAQSARRYHTAVVALFHPNVFRWRPAVSTFLSYRDGFARAAHHGLWIADLEELRRFEQARQESPLASDFQEGRLTVAATARVPGLTLALPATWQGRPLVRLHAPAALGSVIEVGDPPEVHLVTLPAGQSVQVVADYGEVRP